MTTNHESNVNGPISLLSQGGLYVFNRLVVIGNHLAEKIVEKCQPVLYKGMVRYLSHKERVAIISNNNTFDFDTVPSDFDGPKYKKKVSYRFINHSKHFFIATEWDGSRSPVYAEEVGDGGILRCDMVVLYQDGTYSTMSQADFRMLVGKRTDPVLYGTPTNPAKIVMRALMGGTTL